MSHSFFFSLSILLLHGPGDPVRTHHRREDFFSSIALLAGDNLKLRDSDLCVDVEGELDESFSEEFQKNATTAGKKCHSESGISEGKFLKTELKSS